MRGRGLTWWVFAACAAVVLAVLTLITRQTLALERRDALARAAAARQDRLRLALWRIDSALSSLISREAGRAYFEYRPLVPIARPYELRWDDAGPDEPVAPSALLSGGDLVASAPDADTPSVVLRFELDPARPPAAAPSDAYAGLVHARSPEAPTDAELARLLLLDPHTAVDAARVARARQRLSVVQREFAPAFAPQTDEPASVHAAKDAQASNTDANTDSDFAARREFAKAAASEPASSPALARSVPSLQSASGLTDIAQAPSPIDVGPFAATWALPDQATDLDQSGPRALVLLRTVRSGLRARTQGVWLDWSIVQSDLLDALTDLARTDETLAISPIWPRAESSITPELARASSASGRLATLPAEVVITPAAAQPPITWTPARTGLVVSWAALLAALAAIALVLREAIRLSQRRGLFVTAVTHELRTPLTTFRMYSQMLADGMVRDERVRAEYLDTLKQESGRLAGIVENVLAYARLGTTRGRAAKRRADSERTRPEDLLARVRPALSRRAAQAGMDLVVHAAFDAVRGRVVTIDPAAAERILTNLVDNACKYAAPANDDADTRIHLDLTAAPDAGTLEILIADHGPGIAPADRSRIFGEFRRGGQTRRTTTHAAHPDAGGGLGLGLALSRGLARQAGGDLVLTRRRGHGAEFLLTLPLVDAAAP